VKGSPNKTQVCAGVVYGLSASFSLGAATARLVLITSFVDEAPVARLQVDGLEQQSSLPACTLKDFKLDRVLGTGSFGRVSLARHIATERVCAIKALSKANIVKNQQVRLLLFKTTADAVMKASWSM